MGFETTMKFIKQENCYDIIYKSTEKIMFAYSHFSTYVKAAKDGVDEDSLQKLKTNFMSYCEDLNCDLSLYSLLKTLDGRFVPTGGCDVLTLLYTSGEIDP